MDSYQILVPIIALCFLAYTIAQFVKGRNTLLELVFWGIFWLSTVAVAIFPDFITERLARWMGVKDNVNAIIFLAIGILFFLQFRLYFLLKRQHMQLTDLVRKLALKEDDPDLKKP